MEINEIYNGNCLDLIKQLKDESIDLIFFSPPYFDLHCYDKEVVGEIGYGQTYTSYLSSMKSLGDLMLPKLKKQGNLVINIMDLVRNNRPLEISNDFIFNSFNSYIFVQRIIWFIRNKMPVASNRRFVNKYEYILHFSKTNDYYFNKDDVREEHSEYQKKDKRTWKWNPKGKCPGNVWDIPAYRVNGKNKFHVASFPITLCERVIKTYSKENDVVLDPFCGSGNSLLSAKNLKRNYIGFELSKKYFDIAKERLEL